MGTHKSNGRSDRKGRTLPGQTVKESSMSLGRFDLLTQLYPEHSCFLFHKWLRYRQEGLLVVLVLDVLFFVIPYITVLYVGDGDEDAVDEEWFGFGFRSSLVDILALMFMRAISSLWGYNRFSEMWRCVHVGYLLMCTLYIIVKMCAFDYESWLYGPVSILITSSSLLWCITGIYVSSVLSPTRQSANLTKVNSTRAFSFIEVERYTASTPIRIMVDSSDGLSEMFYTPTEGSTPEKDHSFHQIPHSSDLHFVTPPESINTSSVNPVDSCEMLISTWKQKMEHAKDLFGKARILAASYVVHQIEAAFNFHQNELLENHPIERISILQSLSSPFCRTLFTDENTARKLISTFENSDGWDSFEENDTSHMWFQVN